MESPANTLTVEQLRRLIGSRVQYDDNLCEVIEVLEDGPALILQYIEEHVMIQADQHGEAHRRVPTTVTVPILHPDGGHYHPAFLQLDVLDELGLNPRGGV